MPERTLFFFWRNIIIVASFTYIASSGPVPVSVDFADTSSGSPTKWLWSFGDGQSSDEQHPTHIYTVAGIFTVTLTAWVETGVSNVYPSVGLKERKIGAASSNFLSAFNSFVSAPWLSTPAIGLIYEVAKSGSNFTFRAGRAPLTFDFTSMPSTTNVLVLNLQYSGSIDIPSSKIITNNSTFDNPSGNLLTPMMDVTSYGGGFFIANITDYYNFAILAEPGSFQKAGWDMQQTLVKAHTFSSRGSISHDINVAVDWCGLGWLLVSRRIDVISPSEKNLVVETDKPVHLTAKYMLEKPNKNVKWREKYGMPYRCFPYYDLSYKGSIDQLEPSDTLEHTFPINLMPPSPTLNIVLSGNQCGESVASRSPLLEVDSVFV